MLEIIIQSATLLPYQSLPYSIIPNACCVPQMLSIFLFPVSTIPFTPPHLDFVSFPF